MNWKNYLETDFPTTLLRYAKEHPDESKCIDHPHCCQAPQERRVLFKDRQQSFQLEPEFACAWYGLTLIDQGLFRYFPEHVDQWLSQYPYLRLPVTWAGFGCVEVMPPRSLIAGRRVGRTFPDFVKFFVPEL